jgi:hypothetical protein
MKTEDQAWSDLRAHASAQLGSGFADRVLRSAQGPGDAAWRQLHARAGAQLRPGFAERVLRGVRQLPGLPSLGDQFAYSLGAALVCALAALLIHSRTVRIENERNLAEWQQIVLDAQDGDDDL